MMKGIDIVVLHVKVVNATGNFQAKYGPKFIYAY